MKNTLSPEYKTVMLNNIVSSVKKYRNHQEGEFGREERKRNRDMLSPFFGGEKESNEYRAHLVTRGCYYREEKIASYIVDVLLENNDTKFSDLKKFKEANEIIECMINQTTEGRAMAILNQQQKALQEVFRYIKSFEDIEKGVKRFIHKKHKDLRSPGFLEFWHQINKYTEQKTIDTKLFRNKIESTISFLPTKSLQEANDDLITLFIKQQVYLISKGTREFNYADCKNKYNGIYDTEKGIITFINTKPNNTDNILILREGGTHQLITKLNSSQYPGLYREIKCIKNIFIHHEGFQTYYGGKVTVIGSDKEYLFHGTTIIERFNKLEIEQFSLQLNDTAILAKVKNENGELIQHMFVREKNAYERMQMTHFIDPKSQKTYYIESIIEVDASGGNVYAHVLVKGGSSKKVHVISFADLKTTSVSTD